MSTGQGTYGEKQHKVLEKGLSVNKLLITVQMV